MTGQADEAALLGPAPQALERLLEGGGACMPPGRALDGLSADLACRRVEGAPHTVAEIVAHMQFWQAFSAALVRGEGPALPEHAAGGWPAVGPGDWDTVRRAFLSGLAEAKRLARGEDLSRLVDGQKTVGYELTVNALHNAVHLGQVILLRRMLGAWPPPGGGETW